MQVEQSVVILATHSLMKHLAATVVVAKKAKVMAQAVVTVIVTVEAKAEAKAKAKAKAEVEVKIARVKKPPHPRKGSTICFFFLKKLFCV